MNDSEETKATREALVHDVHVRLTEDDMYLVCGVSQALGMSKSKALRLMLRRHDGGSAAVAAAPTLDYVRNALEKFARGHELHSIAVDRVGANLNQIARHLNSGECVHDDEVVAALNEAWAALRHTRAWLAEGPRGMLHWLHLHELTLESEVA